MKVFITLLGLSPILFLEGVDHVNYRAHFFNEFISPTEPFFYSILNVAYQIANIYLAAKLIVFIIVALIILKVFSHKSRIDLLYVSLLISLGSFVMYPREGLALILYLLSLNSYRWYSRLIYLWLCIISHTSGIFLATMNILNANLNRSLDRNRVAIYYIMGMLFCLLIFLFSQFFYEGMTISKIMQRYILKESALIVDGFFFRLSILMLIVLISHYVINKSTKKREIEILVFWSMLFAVLVFYLADFWVITISGLNRIFWLITIIILLKMVHSSENSFLNRLAVIIFLAILPIQLFFSGNPVSFRFF